MNKEYLEEIQETIIRRIEMSKVMGGLTSSDKKFIDLWNYVIELQDKVNQLETNRDEAIEYIKNGDLLYLANKCSVIYKDNVEVVAICDRLNNLLSILERGKE